MVVINKADRTDARPDDVVDEVFDLLVNLNADDDALDFPVIYASAKEGWATTDLNNKNDDMRPVFDAIVNHVPHPKVSRDVPVQMLVTSLEYSDYVGRIAVGKVFAGRFCQGQPVTVIDSQGLHTQQKIMHLHIFQGLGRKQVDIVEAGDICAVSGLDPIDIGNTIACPDLETPAVVRTEVLDARLDQAVFAKLRIDLATRTVEPGRRCVQQLHVRHLHWTALRHDHGAYRGDSF